jgi:hypothetical protein
MGEMNSLVAGVGVVAVPFIVPAPGFTTMMELPASDTAATAKGCAPGARENLAVNCAAINNGEKLSGPEPEPQAEIYRSTRSEIVSCMIAQIFR